MKKPIGIFGGTFDPIHNGHLLVVNKVLQLGGFAEIKLVPCKLPVHKQTSYATAKQRQQMIQLAIANHQALSLDNREIQRETPSFMFETLQSFREEFPETPLILIIGMDSFLNISSWRNWQSLINYAHILVVARPGLELQWSIELEQTFKTKIVTDIQQLSNQLAGLLYFLATDTLSISSTEIRQQIKANNIIKQWLPNLVLDYIKQEKIYL